MHIEVVDNIFYFTQNIGCNEDVVTGALATMFYYCPKFTKEFFKEFENRFDNDKERLLC